MAKKKVGKQAKKVGRPSSYREEYAEQARKLCLLGATDKEMAGFFGVSEQTLNAWKKDFPDFLESLRAGKQKADADVANKLFDRAVGATYVEEQAFKLKQVEYDAAGRKIKEFEKVEVVRVTRAVPPDTPAIALWLKNRRPDLWRDKPEVPEGDDVQPSIVNVTVVDARKPKSADA